MKIQIAFSQGMSCTAAFSVTTVLGESIETGNLHQAAGRKLNICVMNAGKQIVKGYFLLRRLEMTDTWIFLFLNVS